MRRVTVADAERLRRTPGATLLLFLTDRCPVRCAHCSVGSRPDGPTIRDRALFTEVVAGIGAIPELEVVAVSGGEPFAERWGLTRAVEGLHDSGKALVVFTSGYWASERSAPAWITRLLAKVSTVYLSTDGFHARGVTPARLRSAARAAVDAGCHLVVQVLDEPGGREAVSRMLGELLGDGRQAAEINTITPLRLGRGRDVFAAAPPQPLSPAVRCGLASSPTIRYDGTVTACCNEAVIMGRGPGALRTVVRRREDVGPALTRLRRSPIPRALAACGIGPLAELPPFRDLARRPFSTVCEACWAAHGILEDGPGATRLVEGLLTMVEAP
ncbi:radical SAM protein [Microbispora sp. ATCC PTA-5024]|uniref:radical SAM protein n=1 Tax=Microbispora sp. ATCC PTA-5024 TaxID=316330 RepID=UPI0003DDE985|nr:radical SAM protein [Microbispora sp. ATCC PTA-5024]ETK37750.1 hypothetical protein MPTA5024_02120 [Microbispora sp. ATCC PTA-5024]